MSDMIREFMDEAAETSYLDYAIHAILLGDDDVEDQVPEMMGMGVMSFKMYMTYPRRGHDDARRADAEGDGTCR